ncbi:hypothetical protein PTTG_08455 [Puccinia triticina 1-1 BBBD Race 1]|uniref:Protein phosphatase 1 regulatory subunit 7 n=2 Tax=Puccinia triticina TaxID=208348 RepID=A0A180G6I0_PUCT1|nr:uncharacterized protein PtA15_15A36 [Puccinia triticina]OAV88266.1 hypothetical protein PTTG_08455 [Puccinia triticina 1-1 BBBD Race 1]WAQ91647.1 hypothetical protein PtA15_15A36 [Puccinia triticina]WAR62446.1 hypothetical protein PtB15_15B30 [Puccinia triticina]
MEDPKPDTDTVQSPTTDSAVARLDEASYQDGIQERQAILDAQAAEGSKDESVWQAENEELLNEFKEGTEELELSHSRIRTLRGFERHLRRLAPSLKRINLRQNLINQLRFSPKIDGKASGSIPLDAKDSEPEHPPEHCDHQDLDVVEVIAPFEHLQALEELDLYDNQIGKIEGLDSLQNLKTLDFSFNLIRRIENLDPLRSLSTLYLIQNKISQIEALDHLSDTLTSLELGSNRIRHIANLACLTNLTELWLGRNKISKLEGLDALVNLRSLSIQSNRIVKLEGLENLVKLEELYISHNGLTSIGEGLSTNKKLRVLDIGANEINDMKGIEGLSHLEELWANNNKMTVAGWSAIEGALCQTAMPNLQTVYLEGNPLQLEMGANYRRKIMLACPQLIQIDATFVKTQ